MQGILNHTIWNSNGKPVGSQIHKGIYPLHSSVVGSNVNLSGNITPIGKIIRQIMNERGLSEADLCRGVDVPQTTINRLLSCQTNDPRISTLTAIAAFLDVKIEQLLGMESVKDEIKNEKPTKSVPLIKWNCIRSWLSEDCNLKTDDLEEGMPWICTEKHLSEKCFGLRAMPFMEAHFPLNAIILVEPKQEIRDGSFVIISLSLGNPTVRRVIKDGNSILLRKLFTDGELRELTALDVVFGTIVETRVDYTFK